MFKKIGIIGLGVLGGSVARSLKKRFPSQKILGVDRSSLTLKKALRNHWINEDAKSIDPLLKECDFILLCVPVQCITDSFSQLSQVVYEDTLISDVGSVKNEIVVQGFSYFKNFIGSHPLSGSEKSGLDHSREDLFENTVCVMTNDFSYDQQVWDKLALFWKSLGCRLAFLSSKDHDRIVSLTSHLPHILSSCLVSTVDKKFFDLTSNGFFDMTRLALGSSEIWTDILLGNANNILLAMECFEKKFDYIKDIVRRKDKKMISQALNEAFARRKRSVEKES